MSHPSYEQSTVGRVLTMGQGDVGQLGLGEDILERKRPTIVKELENVNIVQLGCGGMHTIALSEDGVVSNFQNFIKLESLGTMGYSILYPYGGWM